MSTPRTKTTKKTTSKSVRAVVVPVDNRNSAERVQDACFEGLIRDYTAKQEWEVLKLINLLYGKILSDRENPDV